MMVVMRRHARPKSPRAARRKLYGAAEAEIGSRVFPLPAPPPPPPMPSVGARRSTRVFVPKATSAAAAANAFGDGDSRVLRSGKRLCLWKHRDDWLGDYGGDGAGDLRWWKGEEGERRDLTGSAVWIKPEAVEAATGVVVRESPESHTTKDSLDSPPVKKFAIVYGRKRQRQPTDGAASSSSSSVGHGTYETERRFGLVFMRKGRRKRPKVAPLPQGTAIVDLERVETSKKRGAVRRELRIATSTRNFAIKFGIVEDSFCTSMGGPMVLSLLVESSFASSSNLSSRLITAIFRWMTRATVTLWELVEFLLSGSLAIVFAQRGIHILPLRLHRDNVAFASPLPSCGICKIHGARQSIPLVWIDFLALPLYFRSLHVSMLLGSLYLPRILGRHLMCLRTDPSVAVNSGEINSRPLVEAGYLGNELSTHPIIDRYEQNANDDAYKSFTQNATILHGSRLSKHRRKRSFSRYLRCRKPSLMGSRADALFSLQSSRNDSSVLLETKVSVLPELMEKPICIEVPDAYAEDSLSCKDESDVSTPLSSHGKQRKSAKKSPVEQNKELKSALAGVRQNIDSVRCNANVLVTDADRCWREEGVEVMLDMLPSKEWCITVKSQGEVRYLHRPLDMRPCVVNRFTHAYMWATEDRWKLEFLDRWDWLVFKELHLECRERNLQEASLRTVPVPVFMEVSGYEEDAGAAFVRPDEYIRMNHDEVQRALLSKIAGYDMDTGDEQWLIKHNSSMPHMELGESVDITEDNFERIIYAMEKDAYSNVDDVFDKEKALDLYQHLGQRKILNAIYDYWFKKRTKRHAALVREFQGPPLRRAQLVHKQFLRKKRSLKRQRSQTVRTKPEVILQVGAHEEALQRVQEAENAANRAVEFAVQLRSRAQLLMANAELAVYKSVMALRIADSIEVSDVSDLDSMILD